MGGGGGGARGLLDLIQMLVARGSSLPLLLQPLHAVHGVAKSRTRLSD